MYIYIYIYQPCFYDDGNVLRSCDVVEVATRPVALLLCHSILETSSLCPGANRWRWQTAGSGGSQKIHKKNVDGLADGWRN